VPVPSPEPEELPWHDRLARLGVLALCVAVFARNLGPLKEGDEWMHLSIGRWMLQHHTLLPSPDPLIWNDRGGDLQHEWLAQVLLAGTQHLLGFAGLRLLRGLVIATCAGVVAWLLRRASHSWSTALGGTALWWLVTQPHAAARPHILGWLFALLVLGVLLQKPDPWSPRRWLAYGTLLVLWAQAHSSQIVAPVFVGLHGCSVMFHRWRDGHSPLDRPWVARTLLATIAVFLQPCGWQLLPYALRSPQVAEGLVEEWAPTWAPDIWRVQPWVPIALALLLLALPIAALWRKRPEGAPFPSILPATLAAVESLHTRRMTFFAWLPLLFLAHRFRSIVPAVARTALALLVAGSVWWTVGRVPEVFPTNDWVHGNFPVASTQFLAGADLRGRLFNPDPWGGWLCWWLKGSMQPSTDGRMLMAGRQWALDSLGIQAHAANAEPLLQENHIEVLLQRRADWLRTRPLDPKRFALAWVDDTAVVILRRDQHFLQNLRNARHFYARYPELVAMARWPVKLQAPEGQASPTDIPSVMDLNVNGEAQ
jgi:hypothetical protein